jgi:ubiquinone/menaquinone biosynthesis C-methylase UbiE
MSYEGGPWLMRAEREKEERCTQLLAALHLKEGDVVADVGCGNGFYTYKFAPLVGAKGRVYAIDIQPEMLELLRKEGEARHLGTNVTPILGTVVDPKLPPASVDLAFLVDVYHEFDHPVEMLAALKKSLKPAGRLVLVEFRLEDPNVPIKLLHRMSKAQMKKELAANGFEVAEEYDELPWQHVMFFRVRKEAEEKAEEGGGKKGGERRDGPTQDAKPEGDGWRREKEETRALTVASR